MLHHSAITPGIIPYRHDDGTPARLLHCVGEYSAPPCCRCFGQQRQFALASPAVYLEFLKTDSRGQRVKRETDFAFIGPRFRRFRDHDALVACRRAPNEGYLSDVPNRRDAAWLLAPEMRAETAAAYCDEPSGRSVPFEGRQGASIHRLHVLKGALPKWHRSKLDAAIAQRARPATRRFDGRRRNGVDR